MILFEYDNHRFAVDRGRSIQPYDGGEVVPGQIHSRLWTRTQRAIREREEERPAIPIYVYNHEGRISKHQEQRRCTINRAEYEIVVSSEERRYTIIY